jgi:SP family general alpha glucoside:H+ symporter-like MFS transporter
MAICYVLIFAGITVEVISHQQSNPNAVFFAGKMINGLAIGALLATALTYIGEVSSKNRGWVDVGRLGEEIDSKGPPMTLPQVAPLALRGILLALSAIAFTLGGIIIAVIINAYGNLPTAWAYKSCFVAQYGVTGIMAISTFSSTERESPLRGSAIRSSKVDEWITPSLRLSLSLSFSVWIFMPESPTWLISVGQDQKAAHALKKLGDDTRQAEMTMATIHLTLERAKQESAGATYLDW